MRKTTVWRLVAVLVLVAVPVVGLAMGKGNGKGKGRPGPVTCPTDGNVGAALATACPCEGKIVDSTNVVQPWRNHGQYVSCVVRYRNALRKAGCFTDDSVRRSVARCAARSTCGKDSVLCCSYELGTCSDPDQVDPAPLGTCSNDGAACNVAADCTRSHARISRTADACVADGGTAVGSGSVCEPCPPPAP